MYQSTKLEVAIIYGRRRVGKTTLISEFCKGKKTVFFAAQADRSISSTLQNYLDHQFKNSRLFLILCGSSMSFMEKQVLGYQSPLYGRRTAQFKIQPFHYLDTGKWFPNYSCEEKAIMYGITGGIPLYLEQFSPSLNIRENLLENLFDKNAMLFEEPSNLMKQELREPSTYNAVITAIAAGRTKLSEIASTVGIETGLCTKYLSTLIALGIIRRETPVTEPASKRPLYLIDDQFFRFWFTFVPRNMSAVLSGRMEQNYTAIFH